MMMMIFRLDRPSMSISILARVSSPSSCRAGAPEDALIVLMNYAAFRRTRGGV